LSGGSKEHELSPSYFLDKEDGNERGQEVFWRRAAKERRG